MTAPTPDSWESERRCPDCDGLGYWKGEDAGLPSTRACPSCGGSGRLWDAAHAAPTWCDGTSHADGAIPPLPFHDWRTDLDNPWMLCARCGLRSDVPAPVPVGRTEDEIEIGALARVLYEMAPHRGSQCRCPEDPDDDTQDDPLCVAHRQDWSLDRARRIVLAKADWLCLPPPVPVGCDDLRRAVRHERVEWATPVPVGRKVCKCWRLNVDGSHESSCPHAVPVGSPQDEDVEALLDAIWHSDENLSVGQSQRIARAVLASGLVLTRAAVERMQAEAFQNGARSQEPSEWHQQRVAEAVEAALFRVESVHQIHGEECVCGFKSARARSRTEHITGAVRDDLAAARARTEGSDN